MTERSNTDTHSSKTADVADPIPASAHGTPGPHWFIGEHAVHNLDLSRSARGLLLEILVHGYHPITFRTLLAGGIEGRDALYRMLGELQEHGYLEPYMQRRPDGSYRRGGYRLSSTYAQGGTR